MKKFSWILALIIALTTAFVFVGCPASDDDSSSSSTQQVNPTPTPTPPGPGPGGDWSGTPDPTATEISVTFEEESVQKAYGSIAYFDDNSGYTYTYGTGSAAGYEGATARFKVDLGTKFLGDYGGFSFTWTGIDGDVSLSGGDTTPDYSKNCFILASGDEADLIPPMGSNAERTKAVIVNSVYYVGHENDSTSAYKLYVGAANVPALRGPGAFDVLTPVLRQKELTGEVWFSIYLPAEPDGGSYSISNFKLIPFADFTEQSVNPSVPVGPPPEEGTKLIVSVAGTNQNTTVIPGNNGTIKYAVGDKAYTYTYGTVDNSNYGNAISRFKLDIGSFRDITDYSQVKFTYTATGDASSSKQVFLLAAKNEADITPWKSDADVTAATVTNKASVNGTDPVDVTLNITSISTALTGEVWFAIHVPAADGTITISNVQFVRGDIKIPAAAKSFDLNLSDWFTKGTDQGGLNPNVPAGTYDYATGKLTVPFTAPNADGQRVSIKLSPNQIDILKNRVANSPIYFVIDATVTDGTGDAFRYHIAAPGEGGSWNATSGSGDGTLATRLLSEQTFNANAALPGRLEYFILQHRNGTAVTIEINRITIGVFSDSALTGDDTDYYAIPAPTFKGWGELGGKEGTTFKFAKGTYDCIIGTTFPDAADDWTNVNIYYTLSKLPTKDTDGETDIPDTRPMKLAIINDVFNTWSSAFDYPQQDNDGSYIYTKTLSSFQASGKENAIAIQHNTNADGSAAFNITITKIVFTVKK